MAPERHDALVLDLDTRGGLAIARRLGRDGYRIGIASRDARASGMRTRHAARRVVLPRPEDDFELASRALLDYLREQPTDVVLTSIDSNLAILDRHRDELAALGTSPALAPREALEIATSKERTLDAARGLGVPVPRSIRIDAPADLEAALSEIGLPAVIKPDLSWQDLGEGGERVNPVYVEDAQSARAEAGRLVRAGHGALVQEFATGDRETLKFFHDGSEIVARLAMASSRTWPPLGGSSVMRWTIEPPPDALAHGERLVDELGLHGYSEAEFRRHADGRPLLMEVNARLSQSVEVAIRAGVDFPRMQFEWARGGPVERVDGYRKNVRVGWLAGEARVLAASLRGGVPPRPAAGPTARGITRDYLLRRTRLDGLDLRDLRPTLGALAFTAGALRRRGTRSPFESPG